VETAYAVDYLTGKLREPRFDAIVKALAGEMLAIGGLAKTAAEGEAKIARVIASGAAAERFGRMVAALGGPADFMEHPERHLAAAPVTREVAAPRAGFVTDIATRAIGVAVVTLGGGRRAPGDAVDHAVGLTRLAALGAEVGPGRPLALVHAREAAAADAAAREVAAAYAVGDAAPAVEPVVRRRITVDDLVEAEDGA
jgi:thymidine phosphorylase